MKYEFLSNNIELLLNEKLLSSDKKTTIKDNKDQIFKLDSFQYSIKNEELKGKNITYITCLKVINYFSSAFINLKNPMVKILNLTFTITFLEIKKIHLD